MNWRDEAICKGTDQTIWFPDAEDSRIAYKKARAICDECPVRQECLDDAIATDELVHGFRGGMKPKERQRYARTLGQDWQTIIRIRLAAEGHHEHLHEASQIDLD